MTRNIIFDLGGVIIDLDISASLNQLAQLIGKPTDDLSTFLDSKDFLDYEKGLIPDIAFRDSIRRLSSSELTDHQIDEAWNAMLLGIPVERMELVKSIREIIIFLY